MTLPPDPEDEPLEAPRALEARLDEALEESFPASDPIAVFRWEDEE